MKIEKLLKPKQVAEMLNVSIQTLVEWERKGELKAIRTPGGHRRYKSEEIEKILKGEK